MKTIEELQKEIAEKKAALREVKDPAIESTLVNELNALYKELDGMTLDKDYAGIIQENKAKGRKVKRLVIVEAEERKPLYFRLPGRQELAAAESMAIGTDGNLDPYKKAERMIVDLYLGGVYKLEEILDDIELFMVVSDFILYHLIEQKKSSWTTC